MAAENDNAEQEKEPNSFELDGRKYEMPELRDLDIDEWMIVYKYSKVVLRDLMEIPDDPEAEMARVEKIEQPGVMKALFHVAYKRAHPKKTDAAVENLVGQIKYLPTLEAMNPDADEEVPADDETDPTEETSEPESEPSELDASSMRSSDSSSGNGSSASTTSSETPEEEPASTGTSG